MLSSGLPQLTTGLIATSVQVSESPLVQATLKGQSTAFHLGSFTDADPTGGPWAVDIIWGDGSPDSTFMRTTAGGLGDLSHTYASGIGGGFSLPGFSSGGNYAVAVRVTDRHGVMGIGSFSVGLTNVPNVVAATLPQTALKGQAATFQLGSFTDSGAADGPWKVDVNWRDGSADSQFTRTSAGSLGSLAHTYTGGVAGDFGLGSPGNPVVQVQVINRNGDIGVGSFAVSLTNIPHVATPIQFQTAVQGASTAVQLGTFTDSGATDGPWVVNVNWGDGSTDNTFTRTSAGSLGSLNHIFANPGPGGGVPGLPGVSSDGVTVTVTNRHGDVGSATMTLGITNFPLWVAPAQPQTARKGVATAINLGSFTDPLATDQPWTVHVSWGDGTPDTTFTRTTAGSLGSLMHTYTGSGSLPGPPAGYWVGITVTSRLGDVGVGGFLVAMPNVPQVIEPFHTQGAVTGQSTIFHLGLFTDGDATDGPWTVMVQWGDGTPGSTFTRTSAGFLGDLAHTYAQNGGGLFVGWAGVFTAQVTVTNRHGDSGGATMSVLVTNIPRVREPLSQQDVLDGTPATFQLGSFTDSGRTDGPWAVDINWGDGSPDTTFTRTSPGNLGAISHTFPDRDGPVGIGIPDFFGVSVRVTNQHGDVGTGEFGVTITNIPQLFQPLPLQNAQKGKATTFQLGSFSDAGPADGPWTVDVNWGDGSPDTISTWTSAGSLGTLTHTYPATATIQPGGLAVPMYNAWVKVTNHNGDIGAGEFGVTITNIPRVNDFYFGQNGQKGIPTTYQLGTFTDADPADGPWRVDVNWGDGSADSILTRTTAGSLGSLAHTYPANGKSLSYTATVRVTNRHGDVGSGTFPVTITNVPRVQGSFAYQPALRGQATTFQLGSFTDSDPTDGPWTVDVNWGDGSTDSTFTRTAVGSLGTLSHTYAKLGPLDFATINYTMRVTVTNRHGDSGTGWPFSVLITNVPQVAEPLQSQGVVRGQATMFQLGSFTDPVAADGPWTVDINWGDGTAHSTFSRTTTGSLGTLVHTYADVAPIGLQASWLLPAPQYMVTVRVTNHNGDAGTSFFTASITNYPVVTESAPSQTAVAGQSKSFQLGSFADSGAADGPWQVDVNWGDGSPLATFTRTTAGSLGTLAHTYAGGRLFYSVTVSVANRHGDVGDALSTVTLNPPVPGPALLAHQATKQTTAAQPSVAATDDTYLAERLFRSAWDGDLTSYSAEG